MPELASRLTCNWLCRGDEVFPAMIAAIDSARSSVCLETYTYCADPVGERIRDALMRATQRGVKVRVLIDALGSVSLPWSFWDLLRMAGGEVRLFNPLNLRWMSIRDHRKMLVCDERLAFIGGFNIAAEYEGDGVKCGWCDLGLKIEGALVAQLAASFDAMFERADFRRKRVLHLPKFRVKRTLTPVAPDREQILYSGPALGVSPIKKSLRKDLAQARDVKIIVAYFLPTWRLRRSLTRVVERGGNVQFILAGKSDVRLSQLAGQSLYRRFLKTGVQIFEYQPQILHAKLLIVDDIVYIGSANLDQRSLRINYELMVRIEDHDMAEQAREVFARNLQHCRRITLDEWRRSRTVWEKLKQRLAYLVLVRLDPYIARRQWRALPD